MKACGMAEASLDVVFVNITKEAVAHKGRKIDAICSLM